MNERQQLTLECIATRIEWLRLLAPEFQGLRRRDMIDKYGFPVLREIENVEEFGCPPVPSPRHQQPLAAYQFALRL